MLHSFVNSALLFESPFKPRSATHSFHRTCALFPKLPASGPSATTSFAATCALLKTPRPQPIDSRPLSHSSLFVGGYTPVLPISELAPNRHSPSQNRHSPVTPRFSPNSPCPVLEGFVVWASSGSTEGGAMTHTTTNRTRRTHTGLALIALGTVMILANVSVVAGFFATHRDPDHRRPCGCVSRRTRFPAQRRLRPHRPPPLRGRDIGTIPRVRGSPLWADFVARSHPRRGERVMTDFNKDFDKDAYKDSLKQDIRDRIHDEIRDRRQEIKDLRRRQKGNRNTAPPRAPLSVGSSAWSAFCSARSPRLHFRRPSLAILAGDSDGRRRRAHRGTRAPAVGVGRSVASERSSCWIRSTSCASTGRSCGPSSSS